MITQKQIDAIITRIVNNYKLTDYAIGVRYPEELLEPTLEEAKEAFEIANKMRRFILSRITL